MSERQARLLYFAWLRERMGTSEEYITIPTSVKTAADLLSWLAQRNDAAASALQDRAVIRVALDKKVVKPDAEIKNASEIALFPPMTGG